MSNEWLWLIMLILNFAGILFIYKFLGKMGLYAWVGFAIIVANLQVLKTIEIFGLTASLGNIVYATSFLATDILSENYGKRDANRAVFVGFFSLIGMTVLMNLALVFDASAIDFAQESMELLYSFLPRIALASLLAYGVSQIHDVWMYAVLKKKRPGNRWIWLRNNLSTMLSQGIDSIIFCTVAFAGVVPMREFWEIISTTYILKCLVAVSDTPLVYLARHWFKNNRIVQSG